MTNGSNSQWWLFNGSGEPRPYQELPPPPPWRVFAGEHTVGGWLPQIPNEHEYWKRARTYRVDPVVIDAINAALWLRRPLLLTGSPGTGKTTLIYRVAYELGLGPVLEWAVNSRSRLQDALYEYDALGRLQDQQREPTKTHEIGQYIKLRAMGTALLPASRPRALLIDEIDKADPDLPNDLLNIFEEGSFEISELVRERAQVATVRPMVPLALQTSSQLNEPREVETVTVMGGTVRCSEFPFVVITSNGEREFPPAFLRRCIRARLPDPDVDQLKRVVGAHLGDSEAARLLGQIERFAQAGVRTTAMDQFLNSLYLVLVAPNVDNAARKRIDALLTQPIMRS
jgi:MoxR-like ATPase